MWTRLLQAAVITFAFYLMMTLGQLPIQKPNLVSDSQNLTIEVDRFKYLLARVIDFLLDPIHRDA